MKRIELTQGKFAIVDDADYEWLNQWKWHASKVYNVYYAKRAGGKILMHRELLCASEGQQIDHKNGNGLDNQRHNIRLCTNAQNAYNAKARCVSSRFKGVGWSKIGNKWQSRLFYNGKCCFLGLFENEIEAALAYNEAAQKLFGKFARLNNV